MSEQEREKPLHKGVVFVEISKDGHCRVTGYTGSKEDGDQNLLANVTAKDPARLKRMGAEIIGDAIDEMFLAFRQELGR